MILKKINPIKGYILVIDEALPNKTDSGLHLVRDQAKEVMVWGKVMKTSDRTTDNGIVIKPSVVVGDKVFYKCIAGIGSVFALDNGGYCRLIKEEEIFCKIENTTEIDNGARRTEGTKTRRAKKT